MARCKLCMGSEAAARAAARAVARANRQTFGAAAAAAAAASRQDKRMSEPVSEEPDAGLVTEVRAYMKSNKLTQVMVVQDLLGKSLRWKKSTLEKVISKWLSLKFHLDPKAPRGHNAKVHFSFLVQTRGLRSRR